LVGLEGVEIDVAKLVEEIYEVASVDADGAEVGPICFVQETGKLKRQQNMAVRSFAFKATSDGVLTEWLVKLGAYIGRELGAHKFFSSLFRQGLVEGRKGGAQLGPQAGREEGGKLGIRVGLTLVRAVEFDFVGGKGILDE
jgi:hypothetical protein